MILVVTYARNMPKWQRAFGMKKHQLCNERANLVYLEHTPSRVECMKYDIAIVEADPADVSEEMWDAINMLSLNVLAGGLV